MKTSLLFAALGLLVFPFTSHAVFNVGQGGTGATSFGSEQLLFGNGVNPLGSDSALFYSTSSAMLGVPKIIGGTDNSFRGIINFDNITGSDKTYKLPDESGEFVMDVDGTDGGDITLGGLNLNLTGALNMGMGGVASLQFLNGPPSQTAIPFVEVFSMATDTIGFFGEQAEASAILHMGSLTSDRTIVVPDSSGTLGLLETNQTWSGVNIFSGGPSATTTINFGTVGDNTSRACFNTKNTDGDDISFYFVGTSMVIENNNCR